MYYSFSLNFQIPDCCYLIFSAGVGRTGTYIALDALYREGEKTGKINVPMYVRTMRKDRMNMIQGDVGFCFDLNNPKQDSFSPF